jgi:hypothetical protein
MKNDRFKHQVAAAGPASDVLHSPGSEARPFSFDMTKERVAE